MPEDNIEIAEKSGPELFRELLRVYPVAELEDYYKNGVWKDSDMRTDINLVLIHRKEAGAPDPPALEDVVMPDLPKPPGYANGIRPTMPSLMPRLSGTATVSPGSATAGGPVAELRLIALFVHKWKLDPTQTKLLLAKMTPARRRYVIQNFKTTETDAAGAFAALEAYIAECESTNAWANATAPPTAAGVTTLKRPVPAATITPVLDPSKKPRLTPIVPTAPRPLLSTPRPVGVVSAPRPVGIVGARVPKPAGVRPPAPAMKPGSLIKALLAK